MVVVHKVYDSEMMTESMLETKNKNLHLSLSLSTLESSSPFLHLAWKSCILRSNFELEKLLQPKFFVLLQQRIDSVIEVGNNSRD